MSAIDMSARVRATAVAAIDKQCFGEDFAVDCTLVVLQHTTGMVVAYCLVTSVKSPLLGQPPLMSVKQIASPQPDPAAVETAVTDSVRELRELSRSLLGRRSAASN